MDKRAEHGTRAPARRPSLRVAAVAALVLTVGLGAISNLLFLAAFQYRPEWFAWYNAGIRAAIQPTGTPLRYVRRRD